MMPPLPPCDDPLLTDAEFTALMAAEHAVRGDDMDETRQRRILNRIEAAMPARVPAAGAKAPGPRLALWLGPLAVAALVAIGLQSFLVKDVGEQQRLKGASTEIPLHLLAYVTPGGGDLRPFAGMPLAPRETLVFDVNLTQPGVVALVVQEGSGPLRQAYKLAVSRAGEDMPLADGGSGYGYRLGAGVPHARICAVAADSDAALAEVLEFLPPRFAALSAAACAEVRAP